MEVDVLSEIMIDSPRGKVAAYAADPSRTPEWSVHVESAEWETAPPIGVGSRLAFVAQFLGRRITYTHEIVDYVPGFRLVMRTEGGAFPFETTYTWSAVNQRCTRMTLRNRGVPSGFSRVVAPFVAAAMRRINRKGLARLKTLLEQS